MKKILLILAIVVCVAVAGSALAVAYNSASNLEGTLTADSYLALSLDSCSTAALHLKAGDYVTYDLNYAITKSEHAPAAELSIALAADTANEKNLTGVQVALFKDSACTTPLKLNATSKVIDDEGTAATLNGAGTIEIKGLEEGDHIYARFFLPEDATVASIGGTMTLNLLEQAA